LTEANFLAVILPEAKPVETGYNRLPVTTRIQESGWIGAKVERPGATDFGFFRAIPGKGADSISGFHSDADQFSVSYDGTGKLIKFFFDGSVFATGNIVINSTNRIQCAGLPDISGTDIEIVAEKNANLTISYSNRPSQVILNKVTVKDWVYDNHLHLLTLNVPKGNSRFTII